MNFHQLPHSGADFAALAGVIFSIIAAVWPAIPPLFACAASVSAIIYYMRAINKLPK
jgi:hypothetical protein